MTRQTWILIALMSVLCLRSPILAEELSDSRTLRESIEFPSADQRRLIVDNVWGSVVVRGYSGDSIEMVAAETVLAKTRERIDLARQEVELQILQHDDEIELYVNGPFRCQDRAEAGNCWNHWHDRYEVNYDFEIKVPYSTDLEVRTVNHGDIVISDVRGDFRIHNVNGSIDLAGMAGSGEAVTVNGPVVASFVANPAGDTHFETINGKIDVSFQPGLSADLEMLARWGELWSEYRVAPLPSRPPTKKIKGDRTIIEVSRGTRVRVQDGGPTHSFETLNGNIYVRKGTNERGDNDA